MHDFFDTYLAQYKIAFTEGNPVGAMCSYNAENGHPSCANDFILNQVIRKRWSQPNAHITTDCGAVSNMLGPPVHAPSNIYATAWSKYLMCNCYEKKRQMNTLLTKTTIII